MEERTATTPSGRRRKPGLGPIGEHVRSNIKDLRNLSGMSTTEMSERLGEIGRPIQATGITKIESGDRRVDVGDLVALALVLQVSPNRLLFPIKDMDGEVKLTSALVAKAVDVWKWATMVPESLRTHAGWIAREAVVWRRSAQEEHSPA